MAQHCNNVTLPFGDLVYGMKVKGLIVKNIGEWKQIFPKTLVAAHAKKKDNHSNKND